MPTLLEQMLALLSKAEQEVLLGHVENVFLLTCQLTKQLNMLKAEGGQTVAYESVTESLGILKDWVMHERSMSEDSQVNGINLRLTLKLARQALERRHYPACLFFYKKIRTRIPDMLLTRTQHTQFAFMEQELCIFLRTRYAESLMTGEKLTNPHIS